MGEMKRCPTFFFFTSAYIPQNFFLVFWMGYIFSFDLLILQKEKVTKVYLSSSILQFLKLSKVANNNKTMEIQYLFNCIEKR